MTLLAVADAARLLGIHPRTLQQWLKLAHLPIHPHPTDARMKGLTLEQVQQLARLHNRSLQPVLQEPPTPITAPVSSLLPSLAVDPLVSAPLSACRGSQLDDAVIEGNLVKPLASLERQVLLLTEQMTRFAATFAIGSLPTARVSHPGEAGEGTAAPAAVVPVFSPVPEQVQAAFPPGAKPPTPRPPNPGELWHPSAPRSLRPIPLMEYGAEGRSIVFSPVDGELALLPDSAEWFRWLATLSSFRFVGPCGRFTAYRIQRHRQPTRSWCAYRNIHHYERKYTLGTTDRLSIARLEELAAQLQALLSIS